MTLYTDLAGTDAHVDFALAVRIEGVPIVLVERAIPASVATALSGYTQFVGITRIEEGEATLDLEDRRELGATLDVEMLDDATATLAALFAVNTRRRTWVTATATATATTLTLQSTSGLINGQTIYVNSETVVIGTVASSTSLTGCTRGANGSTALALNGTATDGDSVYLVPPSWVGRRAYLYGYTLTANGGGKEQLLGVFTLDEPPRHTGDNLWSLRFASVAQEIYDRAIGVGLRQTAITSATTYGTVGTRQTATFTVDDSAAFRLGSSFPTYAILQGKSLDNDVFTLCELQAVALPPGAQTVTVYTDGTSWAPDRVGDSLIVQFATGLRPIAFIGGGPQALLYVLLSNEGQGATTYDRLPGRLSTDVYNTGWRFGAALTTAEVDTTAFIAVQESRTSMMVIDGEMTVSELLREWCLLNGTATRITFDGKLAPFSLATPRTTSTTTIGINSIVPDSRVEVVADESGLFPLGTAKAGYNPFSREFSVELNLIDAALFKRYPRVQNKRQLEFRSIGCNEAANLDPGAPPFRHPASMSPGEVGALSADIMRGDNGLARRIVSLTLTMAHLDLRIGDVVQISSALPDGFSALPDMRGGTLANKLCRVIGRRPRYDAGRVDVKLLILDPLQVVSPAAVISSVSSSVYLNLATTGDEVSGGSPGNDFIVGAAVRIYDVSGGAYHSTTIVSAASITQIQIASPPAFTIQNGVDYVVVDQAASTVGGTSAAGYNLTEFGALGDSTGMVLTTVGTSDPRWR